MRLDDPEHPHSPFTAPLAVARRRGRRYPCLMAGFGVKVGQSVFDADGKRLGRVTRCDPWGFEVQRGFFGPRQWVVRYDEIVSLGEDSIRIARSDADLFELAAGELPHSWPRTTLPEADRPLTFAPGEKNLPAATERSTEPGPNDER